MRSHLKGSVAMLALLSAPAWAQDGATGATLEMCAPVVTVTQTPPEVRITMGEDPQADPQVTVIQAPPVVTVVQCPAVLTGVDGDVAITEAEPEIVVNAAETAELVVTRQDEAKPEGEEVAAQEEAATAGADMAAPDDTPPATTLNTQDEHAAEADETGAADAAAAVTADEATPATEQQAADTPGPAMQEPATAEPETELPNVLTPDTDAAEAPDSAAAAGAGTAADGTDTAGTESPDTQTLQQDATDPAATDPAPTGSDADQTGELTVAPLPASDAAADPEAQDPTPDAAGSAPGQAMLRDGNTALTTDEARSAGLDGIAVIASDDEMVGEISAVDLQSGMAVIGAGGFLGLGERDVAVPMDEISFQRDAEGELRAYLPMASDQIDSLPEYEGAAQ